MHSVDMMRSIATDGVAWSICLCVCLLVMFVSPAKSSELIEMLTVRLTRVGPRNQMRVQIPQGKRTILGVVWSIRKHWESW